MIKYEQFKDKCIFINYVPGAFGSMLYHFLMQTDQCKINIKNKLGHRIFNDFKCAHLNTNDMFDNFHSDTSVNYWLTLNDEDKILYLEENTNKEIIETNLYYPPTRIACYNNVSELKKIFPKSKQIVITFEEKSKNLLTTIQIDKIFPMAGVSILPTKFINLYKRIDKDDGKLKILQHYHTDLVNYYYKKLQEIVLTEDYFVFPFESFFSYEKFSSNFTKMLFEFDFNVDMKNIEILYQDFKIINKKYFDIYAELMI